MKWKVKSKKLPGGGDAREVKKFALFPVIAYDKGQEYRVWLESYTAKQVYNSHREVWLTITRKPIFLEHGECV